MKDANKSVENSDQKSIPLTLEQKVEALKLSDNETYSAIFGKGVVKGSASVTEEKVKQGIDEQRAKLHEALRIEKVSKLLRAKAIEANFFEPDDVVELLNGTLTLDDNFEIVNTSGEKVSIDDAIKNLASKKPHLVKSIQKPGTNAVKPTVSASSNDVGIKPTFKRSQLRDSKFYLENEAAILLAAKENRIINDIPNVINNNEV